MKKFKMIYVEWDDHYATSRVWTDREVAQKIEETPSSKCYSVGFLVAENKKWLRISVNDSETGETGLSQNILKSCVTKRKILKV